MKLYLVLILFLISLIGCTKNDNVKVDIEDINVKTEIYRFDQDFYTSSTNELPELKNTYPFLFPAQVNDSVWVNKMNDKDESELFDETQKVYKNFDVYEAQLNNLFKHIKYYYPKFHEPKIITLLTNIDSENKVILTDSLLLISLDVFLGKNHEFYGDFPNYIKQNFTKDQLIVAVAEEFTQKFIIPSNDKSFVSKMVQEGKKVELMHHFLPNIESAELLGYLEEQKQWVDDNELEIWKYFIQNSLLFSNDPELSVRFINKAPFSKFYTANDKDSPGEIGVWLGWQIVQSYMKNNKVTIQKMLVTPNETIFKKSKYKPKK